MSLYNTGYQHWEGRHRGIWWRRWIIAENGLLACWESRWTKYLVFGAWSTCLVQIALLFFIGQLLVKDSVVYNVVNQLGPLQQAFARGLVDWLVAHPEISVRTTHNILFYYFSTNLRFISMIAVALVIPHLVTRDLSSRAIIVYSSKAISRFDYLLGKFATIFGLLCLTWLGPVGMAWFMGNLLGSDWHFFWHSRTALLKSLGYVGFSCTALGLIGLGISSLTSKERNAVTHWVALWLVGSTIARIGAHTKPWLQHVSITYNLDQFALWIFNPDGELRLARENIPVLGDLMSQWRGARGPIYDAPEIAGAALGLAILIGILIVVIRKQVKPE